MPVSPLETRSYLIELLTPRQDAQDFEADLVVFRERLAKIRAYDGIVSIPDNPLGNLHFTAMEVLTFLELVFQTSGPAVPVPGREHADNTRRL